MRQVLLQVLLQVLQRGTTVKSWSSSVQARSARWRSQVRRRRRYFCVRRRRRIRRRRRSHTIQASALRCTRELVELVWLLVLLAPTQRTPRKSNAQRLRQNTSAYVSIHQHTSGHVSSRLRLRPARAALKTRLERAPLPQRKRASLITCITCKPCNSHSNSTFCRTLVSHAH
jgi:hypothetical protein